MLRYGRYKPSGRSKPASEFLLRAASEGSLGSVCTPVDVNNAVSLEYGVPGSIFDAELCGERLMLRRGQPGESYVFNPSGQSIDLTDLFCVCRWIDGRFEPCGNPVKDSMATKIRPETRSIVAILFVPADEPHEQAHLYGERFRALLTEHCRAENTGIRMIDPAT